MKPNLPFLPKAVFFDMDGVIFDSMPRHAKAWSEAMALEGLPFSEYQVYLQEGRTGSGTVTDVFLAHGRGVPTEEDIKELEEYCTSSGIGVWGKYYSSEDIKPANFSESFHIRISRLCHIDR